MDVVLPLLTTLAAQTASGEVAGLERRVAALEAQLASLRSELASRPAGRPDGVYDATEWIPPDGDLADAIHAIQRDPGCSPFEGEPRQRTGCRIIVPRGIYVLKKTIHLCRMVVLEGVSGRGWGAATRIEADGRTAIHVAGAAYCEDVMGFPRARGGSRATGGWSLIQHIWLRDTGGVWTERNPKPIHSAGVHAEARVTLRDMWISHFTQGVRISADVNRSEVRYDPAAGWLVDVGTNANGWTMQDVHVTSSRHSGVYVDGGDTNAGYTLGLDVIGSCVDGDKYEAFGFPPCANVHDSSFLGNTHLAPHSAHTVDRRGNVHEQYTSDTPNSRNVWVGAYGESGNGASFASGNDVVVGGIARWSPEGGGLRLQDTFINGFCTYDDREGRRPLRGSLCFGTRGGSGLVAFHAGAPPFRGLGTLRIKPDVDRGRPYWRLDLDNLGSRGVLRMLAKSTEERKQGEIELFRPSLVQTCPERDALPLGPGLGYVVTPLGPALCAF